MKRQMKIAAVVSATALLAIGASFTSMAAAKTGNWVNEDGTWYCYDKNDDRYENEFCMSNGVELYVGEDGALVTNSWVEYDGNMYYIGSAGTKTVNNWKLLTPYEDEEADEEWYYFGASGKRVENAKKVIASDVYGSETFYFDALGRVIYGWVDEITDGYEQADENDTITDLVYTNERGARVSKDWVYAYAPGVDEEEDDLDNYSQGWYYVKSLGTPVTGKQSSMGATYLFGDNGRMLSGWVAGEKNADGSYSYFKVDTENEHKALSTYEVVYYTCDVDGHVKKNQWIKDYANTNWENDPDGSTYWYFLEKDGAVFVPTASDASATIEVATNANSVSFVDGVLDKGTTAYDGAMTRIINNAKYLFNADGQMLSGLKYIDGDLYYFGGGNDGAMKTGAQTIADSYGDDYKFYFGTVDKDGYKKGAGVTGAANSKLYIGGLLETANGEYKYKVVDVNEDGVADYIVNKNGSIQTSKTEYKDDGEVICDASDITKFSTDAGNVKGSIIDNDKKFVWNIVE